jgi:hypothetical protein
MKKELPPPPTGQTSNPENRLIVAEENGTSGGHIRAARYDHWVLAEWSSRGGKAVLEKYGREYFKEIRKHRTNYPKYKSYFSESPVIQPTRRVLAARMNGRKGGIRRATYYSPACLQAMARAGGIATRDRYGSEFYREIRKKRKHYLKGYITKKTKERLREWAIREAKAEKNPALAAIWRVKTTVWEE